MRVAGMSHVATGPSQALGSESLNTAKRRRSGRGTSRTRGIALRLRPTTTTTRVANRDAVYAGTSRSQMFTYQDKAAKCCRWRRRCRRQHYFSDANARTANPEHPDRGIFDEAARVSLLAKGTGSPMRVSYRGRPPVGRSPKVFGQLGWWSGSLEQGACGKFWWRGGNSRGTLPEAWSLVAVMLRRSPQ